jgi:NTP pyrophosphatase (non-canonical NTP hydrolase)
MKNLNLELLKQLSANDMHVPLYKKIIKLQEEAGEVAQEFLAYDDKKNGIRTNSSKSAKGTLESIIEETCDAVNVAIDILNWAEQQKEYKDNLGENFIEEMFERKLRKWESKQIAPKE